MTSEEHKAIRDLTDGFNAFRSEINRDMKKMDYRVTTLESEGLPQIAINELKNLALRVDQHLKSEEKKTELYTLQLREVGETSKQTLLLVANLQQDMLQQGRKEGIKSGLKGGLAASTLMPVVAGIVYALLQHFGG